MTTTKKKKSRTTSTARVSVLLAVALASASTVSAVVVVPKGEVLPNNSRIEEDTVVEELNLASNMSYTVISTATLTFKNIVGGAFRLTAQGYGTYVFENIDNAEMSLTVTAQTHVKFRSASRPEACAGAFFHVDASDEETMTLSSLNGTNFVTRWSDVRGEGHPYAEKNPNINCKGLPFAVNGYQNGRPVVDFGTLWQYGGLNGVGASQVWSEPCARPVEVFAVIGDTEDSSANVSGAAGVQYRNNSWYGHASSTTGYRGNGATGSTCEILNGSALIRTNAAAKFMVDGDAEADATTLRPSADSMHVVSWYATNSAYVDGTGSADAPINAFASERDKELGGVRIAEYIVFDKLLPASDRADIVAYLTRKWQTDSSDFTLASITLVSSDSSSAEMILSGGAKVSVGTFYNDGTVSGNGTITATREERSLLTLSADRTIDVPAGSVCAIDQLADTGYRLIKTGAGKLVINSVNSTKTRIRVEKGVLEFKDIPSETPTALDKAWFHVDASVATSLVSEVSDGTNFVTRWSDVRGEGHPYAERNPSPKCKGYPFVAEGYLKNGLPVVDFGTLWQEGGLNGVGASQVWSETCARPVEVFAVIGDTEDSSANVSGAAGVQYRNNSWYGSTSDTTGYRGNGAVGTTCELLNNAAHINKRAGARFTVDGETVTATAFRPSADSMHVVSWYATSSAYIDGSDSGDVPINAFASERDKELGGIRIGEYVVFDRSLSAAEREAVNTYLYNKWKNEIVVGELEVKAGATVSVPDGSTVRTRILRGDMPEVSGGRLAVDLQVGASLVASSSVSYDPLAAAEAWFHVDATASSSMVAEVRDGTNYVSRWNDVRGAGIYAEQSISKTGLDPYVTESALNGLPVMDFGTTWNGSKRDGYGAAMKWSKTLARTMEIFVIEQHNDDMKSIIAGSTSTGPTFRNQVILGENTSYPTLVTGNPDGVNDSVSVIGSTATIAFDSYAGRLLVDLEDKGLARDANYHPGYGFHLYNIYMTGSTYLNDMTGTYILPLNAFACERDKIYGGQRIAECLVFDRVLSSDERALYGGLLYAKWFNGSGAAVVYENATVPAGVTLELPYQALSLSGRLEIGGCVKAVSVAPAAITVTGLDATVDGTLALGSSGGIITLPGSGWDSLANGEYRLIGASAISGSVAGWTVAMPDCTEKVAGAPVARSDGIYASISRRTTGICIIIR